MSNSSVLDQFITVFLQNVRHAANLLVHEWLREHRFINLIVAVAAIAYLMKVHHTISHSFIKSANSTIEYSTFPEFYTLPKCRA